MHRSTDQYARPLLGNVKPMLSHDGQDFSRVVKCFLSNLIVPDTEIIVPA